MDFTINNMDQLPIAAKKLFDFANNEKVFLFFGDMGAGKTTFIKAFCKHLGVDDIVTSPTYSLVNEYDSQLGKIFHFDFYRIKNEVEAFDIGFEEYLDSNNYCLIEWPEKIINLWPKRYVEVSLSLLDNQERKIIAEIIS